MINRILPRRFRPLAATPRRRTAGPRPVVVLAVISLVATTFTLGFSQERAEAAAADIDSMTFYGSELIWQPGDPQPVHDTSTNTVSSFGPIKNVICGTVVTFFQKIVMDSTGVDDVLRLSYELGYDSSSNDGVGLRDVVGLYIHPDSTDLDADATVSLLSENLTPNPDVGGTVRVYEPLVEVTGLDANETIWVQMDVLVGCDLGAKGTGTVQAVYAGAVETTSGEALGGGAQTIPGLSPSAPPSWAFTKEPFDSSGDPITVAEPFEEVTFRFTIANTGLEGLAPPTIADSECAPIVLVSGDVNNNGTIDGPAGALWPDATFGAPPPTAVAETWVWECTTTIGSSDHSNTATLSGMPKQGVGATSDTVSLPVVAGVADLAVTKTVDPPYFEVAESVTWTIEADNTGTLPLESVTLTDDDCNSPTFVAASDSNADGSLDPDEIWHWTCTSDALTATLTNTATVSASDSGGNLVSDDGSATATIAGITLDKQPPSGPISSPGDVTYTFVVSNSGDTILDEIAVADPLAGPVSCPVTSLAPAASTSCTATYAVTQADVDTGTIENTATASGNAPDGSTISSSDTVTTSLVQNPSWTVTKSTPTEPTAAGDVLDYEFVLTNTGNVSISEVVVSDAKCASTPSLSSGDTDLDAVLDVGEQWRVSCTSVAVTQAEVDAGAVDNSVEVTGVPAGGQLDPATASISTPVAGEPSWTVTKWTSSAPSAAGETLVYSFTVANTGAVPISAVSVTDAKCASAPVVATESIAADGVLAPSEIQVWSCTSLPVTQAEVDAGEVNNSVSVSGTPPNGTLDPVTASISTAVGADPSLTVAKSTPSVPTAAGQALEYRFEVVNTGNVTVNAVSVSDAKCASAPAVVSESIAVDGVSEPGETQIWSCTSVPITQAEVDAGAVDNSVEVTGTPARGTLGAAFASTSTPVMAEPSWTVVKATASVPAVAGQTLDYTFDLVNTGNVTITDVVVADGKCDAPPVITSESITADGVLAPGESQLWSCMSIPVTQAEVDAGAVDNSVEATGVPARGVLPQATASISTPVDASPSWSVVKAASSAPTSAGQTVDYTFAVINTGNVTVSGVTIADAKCATPPAVVSESVAADEVLVPGESQLWSCTSIPVTQAEVDAGTVDNRVEVTGAPAGGILSPAIDDHSISVAPNPSLHVMKATTSLPTAAGQTLPYTFDIFNDGNVTISDVVVTDAKCAAAPSLVSESIEADKILAPGETQVWSCTSIAVTQAEVDAGRVDNDVEVTGTAARGILAPATDAHSVPVDPAPSWAVVKATTSAPTAAGQTLEYAFTVVNTGNVSVFDVLVSDAKCATTPSLVSESDDSDDVLVPGETQVWSCTSLAVTQAEIDAGHVENSVTISGTTAGGTLDPANDTHSVVVAAEPSWDVVKATASAPTVAGETLLYTFTVVNNGNVTITDVDLADTKCGSAPVIDSESIAADKVLEPGETQVWSCTSIPVTQAEVDAGAVDNTVEVIGTPANGTLDPASDAHSVAVLANPSWSVVKATLSAPTAAGQTLEYTFDVVNDGNVSITGVTVIDAKCDSAPVIDSESIAADSVLEPGESQVWSCTSIPVTQAEVDAGTVDNTVEVTGDPAGGTLAAATAMMSTRVNADPSWGVVKSTSSMPGAAGDTLEYTFTLVNTGNVTVSDVIVADLKCATTPALVSESITGDAVLEPGETQVWSCASVPVTQGEVDAGTVDNSVAVTGTPAGGALDPATASISTPVDAEPSWSVVKTTASTPTAAGETLDYSFTVVNTGNVTIAGVSVADPKCAAPPALVSESILSDGVLVPGEIQVWSCTSLPLTQAEVDAGTVDNTAIVTGAPAGGALAPATDTHGLSVAATPSWVVTKATSSVPTSAGQTLEYTFDVFNTGNVTITAVALTDANCVAPAVVVTESIAADTVLDPGETQVWSCTSVPVTQAEVDAGAVENSVTISGTPAGGALAPATASISTPIDADASWSVIKATSSVPGAAGETLEYSFTVVNTGNVTVAAVTLTDAKCAGPPVIAWESIAVDTLLEPGEIQVWACTSVPLLQAEVDAGAVDNTVIVSGTPAGGILDPATAAISTPIDARPSWTVVKAASSAPINAGETLDYSFTLVNTGNVTIAGVTLTDAKCATTPAISSESIAFDNVLVPGETQIWSCTSIAVTQAEVDSGIIENSVAVTGAPAGGILALASDTHSITVPPNPSWHVQKTTISAPTEAGDFVDYTFTITSTGNVSITGVTVTDPKCPAAPSLISESIAADSVLVPGEIQVWSCASVAVTQAEVDAGAVDNSVDVTGTPAGGILVAATDDHRLPIAPQPSWSVTKATSTPLGKAGETLDYTFTVVNTGNVSISAVSVADPKCGSVPVLVSESIAADSILVPGETQIWSCTSVAVTQAEIDAGRVDNAVTIVGTPAGGAFGPASDAHSLIVAADPSWTLNKSTGSAPTRAGETLVYAFTLVNNGNVSINGVAVADSKCSTVPVIDSESIAADRVLAPGETQIWSCTSIPVTQAEVDAGAVENSASASGVPANGTLGPATDGHTVAVLPNPSWSVVKATSSVPTAAGQTLEYTFDVLNDGNVTISGVAVVDSKCATPATIVSESVSADGLLQPGETQLWSCTSVPVTQAEVDAGAVVNTVEVAGAPAGGTLAPAKASVSTPVNADPSWAVVKSTPSAPGAAGETLDYSFTVVNTGNVTIAGVNVVDSKCATPATIVSESVSADGLLQPGETQVWSCTSVPVTQAEVDAGVVVNAVEVAGAPAGGTLAPAKASVSTPVNADPSWAVVKSTSSAPTAAGESMAYSFTVVNTGNVTIAEVSLVDVKCAAPPALVSESIAADVVLVPGEIQVWSCTSVSVTQAEVDDGMIDNAAEVTGVPAGGMLEPALAKHGLSVTPKPSWIMTKATGSVAVAEGDTLEYTFDVVNTGNVTISDVTVTDAKCVAAPVIVSETITANAALEPGEIQVWSCTSVPVTQAEVDAGAVDNTATVTGEPAGGILFPATSSISTPIDPDPSWSVVKATSSVPGAAGDTLDYSFTVVNTGNVSISKVIVTDAKCATPSGVVSESIAADDLLVAGEVQVWSCTSVPVTQAEVDAGRVDNSVTISGSPAGGMLDPATAAISTPVNARPSWTIVKATSSVPTTAGETLDYTFTLVNTGNVTITGVAVVDPKCGTSPALLSESIAPDAVLAPSETQIWSCESVPVTQAEVDAGTIDNAVEATGAPAGGTLSPATDTHRITVPANPSWHVRKAATSSPRGAGETVDYTFALTNTGNVTIDDVRIIDAKCATTPTIISENLAEDAVLEPTESQTWACTSHPITQAEVDSGAIVNHVDVTGTPAAGTLAPATDDHTLPVAFAPAFEVLKSTSSIPGSAGEVLDYTFTVINTGNVTIADVIVIDIRCAAPAILDFESRTANTALEAGEIQIWSCTSVPVTQAEVDTGEVINRVGVVGTPAGGTLAPAIDELVTPVAASPSWQVVKGTASTAIEPGDVLDYSFTLVNTGNVTIADVVVNDAKCAASPVLETETVSTNSVLDAGETQIWSCTSIPVTQAEVDAGHADNHVDVTGDPLGGVLAAATDTHVLPIAPNPSWAVLKSAASQPGAAGETLSYRFRLINTGNVTISEISINDAKCAAAPALTSETAEPNGVLEAGETQLWSCTSIPVTQAEIDAGEVTNRVDVAGTPAGGTLPTAVDTVSTPARSSASWEIVKTTPSVPSAPGQTLDYTFTVVNTGNVTIFDVVVSDAKCQTPPTLVSESATNDQRLQPGEVSVWSCTSVPVTQAEVDDGEVENRATVTGTPTNGTLAPAAGSHSVSIRPVPAWTLTKTTLATPSRLGESLWYNFVLTNEGNVTITQISVSDMKCSGPMTLVSGDIGHDNALEAGEAWTLACSSIPVTAAEVAVGRVTNSASAHGIPAGGELGDVSASSTTLVARPDVSAGHRSSQPATVDVLANDGDGSPLDPASVLLRDPSTGHWVQSVAVPGEGLWTVDPETGLVTFVPQRGFFASPSPVEYRARTADGSQVLGALVELIYMPPIPANPTDPPAVRSVFDPDPVGVPQSSDPQPGGSDSLPSAPLAHTGSNTRRPALLGFALILMGGALHFVARRSSE